MCIELEDAVPYEMHAHEVYTLEELVARGRLFSVIASIPLPTTGARRPTELVQHSHC